jgi:hypothetical protein
MDLEKECQLRESCGRAFCGTYDFEGVGNDADCHKLFAVVAAVHHKRVSEALNDRALSFSEALLGISACGVGDVDRGADLDIVAV